MEVELKYIPTARQLIAHNSRAKYILYGGATAGGKSVWICNDALRHCLYWAGNKVGIFRWENHAFTGTTYETMKKWILGIDDPDSGSPGKFVKEHNQSNRLIEFYNGSTLRYGGLKPSSSASGDPFSILRSLELSELFVDEVTDMPEDAFTFLSTRIMRIKAKNVLTGKIEFPPARIAGTSNPSLGWVKQRWIDESRPDHEFIQSKVTDNPHVAKDYENMLRIQFAHIPGWERKFVDGDWESLVDFEAVLPADWLIAAAKRETEPGLPVEFGVDVGAGGDLSVITMREGMRGTVVGTSGSKDTMDLVALIQHLADKYAPSLIKIDAIGLGKPIADHLAAMGLPIEYIIGGAKSNDDRFFNYRTEIYFELRELLEVGKISLPNDSKIINELGVIKFHRSTTERTVQIEKKDKITERLGHSPDYADSFAYCFAGSGFGYTISALVGE
ncbi:hypothetical protein LCGC14_0234770 [marine sediment metagenome]|uniref:Phage terminase large subunit N-terminal domain-containing protein n=1 Tax=marine sediment metagenome TaxID=412755 RepID=A0A0F9WTK5_9ZZZZ